jgi:hypothetical protein
MDSESPEYIVARACSSWGNPPIWWGQTPDCNREEAEAKWLDFISFCCQSHGLAIVPIGAMVEIEAEHG